MQLIAAAFAGAVLAVGLIAILDVILNRGPLPENQSEKQR